MKKLIKMKSLQISFERMNCFKYVAS